MFNKFYSVLIFTSLLNVLFAQSQVYQKTDEMMQKYLADDLFAGTVLIAHNGEIKYNKAFGYLNKETKVKHTIDSQLKIGSIVKNFTAILILKLAENGQLHLDDPIAKYTNQFNQEIQDNVTIRQLLKHESGFGDYLMFPEFQQNISELKTVDSIINLFKQEPLLFEPGTDNRYSNSGYTVLGAIIEKITRQTYFEAVKELILKPLNMNKTLFDWRDIEKLPQRPKWYMRSATGKIFPTEIDEWPSPSGGAYSTTMDMFKFEYSLTYDILLLSDASKALKASRFKDDENHHSWEQIIKNKETVFGKAGGSPGNNSVILNMPAEGFIIIVLANYDEPVAEEVGKNILSIIRNHRYSPPRLPVFEAAYRLYTKNGIAYLKSQFQSLVKQYDFQDPEDFILNRVGYDLIAEDKLYAALDIFKANVDLFPNIANTWDSLGEIYMLLGNNESAIKNYKKSLELNPQNKNASEMLIKLNQ